MALFSQRKKIMPMMKAIQKESIDDDLKNKLWSAINIAIWECWEPVGIIHRSEGAKSIDALLRVIWVIYFKLPIDTLPAFKVDYPESAYNKIRNYFYNSKWWQIFDIIEFIINNVKGTMKTNIVNMMNSFLQSENSAYRLINNQFAEITDDIELDSIELATESKSEATKTHLKKAIEFLSDRKNPDFRNSIKESISAIEAICQKVSLKPKATLIDCIKTIKSQGKIHPSFEQALIKLYSYTCDEGGIRHALTDPGIVPGYADAKYMLVISSAFINYITLKSI